MAEGIIGVKLAGAGATLGMSSSFTGAGAIAGTVVSYGAIAYGVSLAGSGIAMAVDNTADLYYAMSTSGGSSGGSGNSEIPDKALDVTNHVKSHNGAVPQGYKGGRTFNNDPVNEGQKLPEGVTYREYDVNPYVKGQNRGAERVVIGSDGSVWYANDHYHTFNQVK